MRRIVRAPLPQSPRDLPSTSKPLLAPEMAEVDRVLRASLDSDVALIRQVADYIVGGGGKRLRPALVLLLGRARADTTARTGTRSPRSSR